MHEISVKTVALLAASVALLSCASGSSGSGPVGGSAGSGNNAFGNSTAAQNPIAGGSVMMATAVPVQPGCNGGPCSDFPAQPIIDQDNGSNPPSNAAQLFGSADNFSNGGPCVIEPQLSNGKAPGTLFPKNWVRPRFHFTPSGSQNLWEIRLQTKYETTDLVAYTTNTTWTLPRDIWKAFAMHTAGSEITVTIRGVDMSSPKQPGGTRGTFGIAPVEARGKLVYWATTSSEVMPTTSKLVGFDVGDESVIDALTIPEVGDRGVLNENGRDPRGKYDDPRGVPPGAVQCIGCHTSTPDGAAVAFTDHWPWDAVLASIEQDTVGQQPTFVTPGAQRLLNQPWMGMETLSMAHFTDGDRILVTSYAPRNLSTYGGVGFSESSPYPTKTEGLAWIDLESKATFTTDMTKGDVQQQLNQQIQAELGRSFGLFKLDGETRSAATPNFSHDGTKIAYTSAEQTQDGRLSNGHEADVHIVPYNNRQGGMIQALQGASDPGVAEYYPAFSADDSLVAFNRVAKPDGGPIYYRPDGEIYVVAAGGGKALRLMANDPPTCTGETSPGIINSWPKWSPSIEITGGDDAEFGKRTYYWLVFSSARKFDGQHELPAGQSSPSDRRSSQLYMTALIRNQTSGELETYPAVYLWNQDPTTSNLTPAWDEFKIPPVKGPE